MWVRVNGVSLYVEVEGAGPPTLVLLHGGPGADHTLFKPESATLADFAQVLYVDQRGSGRSDVSDPKHWTWDQWADDIATLSETLGIDRPVLVGTSSGAVVAMACAARHPGLVAGLVLDSPLGVPTTLEETLEVFERRGGAPARQAAARYLQGDTSDEAAEAWRKYGLPLYSTGPQSDMEQRIARARINNKVQTHFRQGGCGPVDVYEPGVPTLILAGRDDPVVPAAAAVRLAERVRARIHVVDCGHGVLRQAPDRAGTAIAEFLREVRPRREGAPAADRARTDGAAGGRA